MIALTMTLFLQACPNPAYAQEAKVLKRLDDGSIAVEIDGQKYLAITRAQLDAWAKLQLDYDAAQEHLTTANKQIETQEHELETTRLKVTIAEQQRDQNKSDFLRALSFIEQQKQLLEKETELRKQSQQFIPHGSGHGFGVKLLDFFDKPAVQASFKILIPAVQTWKQFSGACRN